MREFVPTKAHRDLAMTLSGYGIPQPDIARLIGISLPTLHKHFREDLDLGMAEANLAVAQNMFKMATGTGPEAARMAIFWSKSRMGWREVPREVNVVVEDRREKSADERARALALMMAKRGAGDERRTH